MPTTPRFRQFSTVVAVLSVAFFPPASALAASGAARNLDHCVRIVNLFEYPEIGLIVLPSEGASDAGIFPYFLNRDECVKPASPNGSVGLVAIPEKDLAAVVSSGAIGTVPVHAVRILPDGSDFSFAPRTLGTDDFAVRQTVDYRIFGSESEGFRLVRSKRVTEFAPGIPDAVDEFSDEGIAKPRFSDIADSPYRAAIEFLATKGIVRGYGDGTFGPDNPVTRAELVKIAAGAKGIVPEASEACFPDVSEPWHVAYVCAAKNWNVLQGYGDGTFQPSRRVSLVEALKISLRIRGEALPESEPWYRSAVERASERRAIPFGTRGFHEELSRGQVADLIVRMMKFGDGTLDAYLSENFGSDGTRVVSYADLDS